MQDKPDMADLMQAVQDFVAEEIAPWYFLQYATAIITLTAFTVWALHIVYR